MIAPHEDSRASLAPQLPCRLGRFTLFRELGAGGMATVYLSKMRLGGGLERLVALKTIHAHLAKQQTFVDMFLDEAKIASQISHPNVCAVYDFGKEGDVYFLAMEHLVGEPLFELVNQVVALRSQSPELTQALPFLAARILADACEGLHAAHAATGVDGLPLDVVHRDVSPQNLFVTYEGAVKVVDFGCAKALERVTQTNTGVMKGKVSYAAPEQLRSEPVDARSDIFALGICLWETLTLRQLFRRDTAINTAMAVLEEPIPRADQVAPWVPRELADIAERALQRDRGARFASAREMGRALRGFIARSGAPFESAELAEWMRFLFEDRYRETLAMVASVEALALPPESSGPVDQAPADAAPTPERSGVARAPRLTFDDEASSAPSASTDDDAGKLPTKTKRWLLIGAASLVLTVLEAMWLHPGTCDRLAGTLRGDETPAAAAAAPGETPDGLGRGDEARSDDAANGGAANDDAPADEVADDDVPAAEAPGDEAANDGAPAADAPTNDRAASTDEPPAAGARVDRSAARPASGERAGRPPREARNRTPRRDDLDEENAYLWPPEPTGVLQVVADNGWAQVEHEGRVIGRTPLRVTLPVGRARLRIVPQGDGPAEVVTVTIEPGTQRTLRVHVEGSPAEGASGP